MANWRVTQTCGLITRRSEVRILSPLPFIYLINQINLLFLPSLFSFLFLVATILATTIIIFIYFTICRCWRQGEMGLIDGSAEAHIE